MAKHDLDWDRAEEHLKSLEEAYAEFIAHPFGMPNVNPFFGLGFIAAVRKRFDGGERTVGLFNEIMDLK